MSDFYRCMQAVAIRDLHPDWLAPVDAHLAARAKLTSAGRILIRRHLMGGHVLFAGENGHFAEMEVSLDDPWLLPMGPHSECWLRTGAWLARRQVLLDVASAKVRQWRRVLGDAVYAQLVVAEPVGGEVGQEVSAACLSSLHQTVASVTDDTGLRVLLIRFGFMQLLGRALGIHPALACRVRLAAPRQWSDLDPGSDIAWMP